MVRPHLHLHPHPCPCSHPHLHPQPGPQPQPCPHSYPHSHSHPHAKGLPKELSTMCFQGSVPFGGALGMSLSPHSPQERYCCSLSSLSTTAPARAAWHLPSPPHRHLHGCPGKGSLRRCAQPCQGDGTVGMDSPGAVAAVDDGVVGGVDSAEVVLRLLHDAAHLPGLHAVPCHLLCASTALWARGHGAPATHPCHLPCPPPAWGSPETHLSGTSCCR